MPRGLRIARCARDPRRELVHARLADVDDDAAAEAPPHRGGDARRAAPRMRRAHAEGTQGADRRHSSILSGGGKGRAGAARE